MILAKRTISKTEKLCSSWKTSGPSKKVKKIATFRSKRWMMMRMHQTSSKLIERNSKKPNSRNRRNG